MAADDDEICRGVDDPASTFDALAVTPLDAGVTATVNETVDGPPEAVVTIDGVDTDPAARVPDVGSTAIEKSGLGGAGADAVAAVVTLTATDGDDVDPFEAIAVNV